MVLPGSECLAAQGVQCTCHSKLIKEVHNVRRRSISYKPAVAELGTKLRRSQH
jgi:hypothetical protein